MKYFTVCCLLLLAIPASAQNVGFGVHGNMINSKLNANLKQIAGLPNNGTVEVVLQEVYGLGVGGGAHLDINLGLLSLRLSGDYVTLSPDKEKFKSFIQGNLGGLPVQFVDGGRVDLISGTVNAKLVVLPLPVFKPYATGGAGIANVKSTPVKLSFNGTTLPLVSVLKDQTVGTFNAGAGLDIGLGPVTIYAEIKITWLMIEEGTSTFVPIATAGITF